MTHGPSPSVAPMPGSGRADTALSNFDIDLRSPSAVAARLRYEAIRPGRARTGLRGGLRAAGVIAQQADRQTSHRSHQPAVTARATCHVPRARDTCHGVRTSSGTSRDPGVRGRSILSNSALYTISKHGLKTRTPQNAHHVNLTEASQTPRDILTRR